MMNRFGMGDLAACEVFGDALMNFEAGIASQGAARVAPAVALALKVGDVVTIDAPAGPWAWMNGRVLTVERFFGQFVWCFEWAMDAGAMVKKEFLCDPAHLRAVKK